MFRGLAGGERAAAASWGATLRRAALAEGGEAPRVDGRRRSPNGRRVDFKKRYAERKAAGLCPQCPDRDVRPSAPGRALCELHLEYFQRKSREWRGANRGHSQKSREAKNPTYYRRLAAGLCVQCPDEIGRPPVEGRTLCAEHAARLSRLNKAKRQKKRGER